MLLTVMSYTQELTLLKFGRQLLGLPLNQLSNVKRFINNVIEV